MVIDVSTFEVLPETVQQSASRDGIVEADIGEQNTLEELCK